MHYLLNIKQLFENIQRGGISVKLLHIVGGLLVVLAVGFIEGGGLNCLQGAVMGFGGGALMIATMNMTGWYE